MVSAPKDHVVCTGMCDAQEQQLVRACVMSVMSVGAATLNADAQKPHVILVLDVDVP